MNSSGIKRGLAGSAITALAISGLPFLASSASAEPMNTQTAGANAIYLAGPEAATVSVKDDGANTTVRLQAVGGTGVAQVRFEYQIGAGAQQVIDTVGPNDNGSFAKEWAPSTLNGATVKLSAVALDSTGAVVGTSSVKTVTVTNNESVNVADGEAVGVFIKPDYDGAAGPDTAKQIVGLSGTSSSKASVPNSLQFWSADTDGATPGNQPGWDGSGSASDTSSDTATKGAWAGTLDITGYNYGGTNQLLVKAALAGGTDDTEGFNLYQQNLTTVTAVADNNNVQAGKSAKVTVTVKDQNGLPVTGAEVRDSDGNLIDQTDGKGQVTTTQGAGSKFYYANATASDAFEAELGDKKSDAVTVTQYAATPKDLTAKSADGAAFDFTEYTSGDITVQVKDQNNNDLDTTGQALRYSWKVTPFDGSAAYQVPASNATPNYSTQAVENDGKFVVELPSGADRKPGTYELMAELTNDAFGNNGIPSKKVLEVKAGQADFKFDETNPEQAAAGTSEEVSGKLVLEDGTGLPGRVSTATYTPAAGGNAGIVQENGTSGASRTVKTGADGSFSVTVKDPAATPQTTESGAFKIETDNTPSIGDADADETTQVQFVKSVTAGFVTVSPEVALAGEKTPGRPVKSSVNVTTGDLDPNTAGNQTEPLSNQEVTLTVDKGFFVQFKDANNNGPELSELAVDPAPAVGANAGEYKSLGQSITVKTDANGNANFVVAIEGDEGFNDDGKVNATVTATLGSLSDTEAVDWTSANPLNPGEVRIEESPAKFQESDALPDAQVGQSVYFEVYAEDQFGNLVGGEDIVLSENGPFSSIRDEDGDPVPSVKSNFADDIDFVATATRPNEQDITASWTQDGTNYTSTAGAMTTAPETVTDTYTINWYELDFAKATFTITSSPEGDVQVGSPVTETVKVVDENGNPVAGLQVQFIRQGPGNQQGGDANVVTVTNSNGEAFYSFTGTEAGTANISAIISDGEQNKTLTDTVTFVAPGGGEEPVMPCEVAPSVLISGDDNGGAKDVVRFVTEDCAVGDSLQLFKIRGTKRDGNKRLVEVRQTEVEDGAEMVFKVRDANGNKKTRFVAKVKGEAYGTAKSNTQKIR